jgi:hypothetical protein
VGGEFITVGVVEPTYGVPKGTATKGLKVWCIRLYQFSQTIEASKARSDYGNEKKIIVL